MERGRAPSPASYIYKIDKDGFVDVIFKELAVFFAIQMPDDDELMLGTGNKAQLFTIEPATETEAIIYEDKISSQITDIVASGKDVYISTAKRVGNGLLPNT